MNEVPPAISARMGIEMAALFGSFLGKQKGTKRKTETKRKNCLRKIKTTLTRNPVATLHQRTLADVRLKKHGFETLA